MLSLTSPRHTPTLPILLKNPSRLSGGADSGWDMRQNQGGRGFEPFALCGEDRR